MAVLEQIQEDVKTALRAGDRERAGALRLVVSELQKAAKDARGDDIDEVAVLQRERKRRLEAADAYRDAGRDELAAAEESEAEAIESYLPEQLVRRGARGDRRRRDRRDGRRPRRRTWAGDGRWRWTSVGGRADGKRVSALVKGKLTG